MVVKFSGTIKYTEGNKITFEIDELDQVKLTQVGETTYEPKEHLRLVATAISAVHALLKSCSPKKFEMQEAV